MAEEANIRKTCGFSFVDSNTFENLSKAEIPDLSMQGTPWYQPLSNYQYSHGFMYIGAAVEDRTDLIEDGILYRDPPERQK